MTIAEQMQGEEDYDTVEGMAVRITWTDNGDNLLIFGDKSSLVYAEGQFWRDR